MVSASSELHPSTHEIVAKLRENYPGVPLIALGQTVFWDEPVKASLRGILDLLEPDRLLILGVHDTDYFAKAPGKVHGEGPYAIVPHNDGSTRELWAAAGEVAKLFGCEIVPSRDTLYKYGVLLDKIAGQFPGGKDELIDTATEAWGWRGLVRVGARDVLAMDVKLAEVLPALLEMLEWGFSGTCEIMQSRVGKIGEMVCQWVRDFAERNPETSLPQLYKDLLPRFYSELLGEMPRNTQVTCSGEIFRFNTETAGRPRFNFVDLFLRPETREICATAYNEALIGAETYTLDRFGHGAIPFDLVVPGRGRGTVRVMPDQVSVDLPTPEHIELDRPVESAAELARVFESRFGKEVAIVGKAVALINMVNSEFMLVFHTFGSPYVRRTREMNVKMAAKGVKMQLNPILRLGHRTWDALAEVSATLCLPDHLAKAFGKEEISAEEFSRRWVSVAREQGTLLETLERITSVREMIPFLQEALPDDWGRLYEEYDNARHELARIGGQSQELNNEIDARYHKINELKELVEREESSKGLFYREHVHPLQDKLWELSQKGITEGPEVESTRMMLEKQEAARAELAGEIAGHRETIKRLQDEINGMKQQARELERGEEAIRLRKQLAEIEAKAQTARLTLVRNAYLTSKGLPYTNFRPSAWWFPMVDPTGKWFDALTRKAEMYLEEIVGEGL